MTCTVCDHFISCLCPYFWPRIAAAAGGRDDRAPPGLRLRRAAQLYPSAMQIFSTKMAYPVKVKRRRIYIALYYKLLISKALRYGPRVTRGSHSFNCHPHTNHTCLYFPAARHHHPLAGTHCAYPRRDGQAELTWVAGHIPR